MKKEIVIPMGKIGAGLAMAEGLAASIVVDAALKTVEVTTNNKVNHVICSIGRSTVSAAIATASTAVASMLWFDDTMNIRIGGKKHKKDKKNENEEESENDSSSTYNLTTKQQKKNRKRLFKAFELWNKILSASVNAEYWFNNYGVNTDHERLFDNEDISEFNHIMMKLSKKFNRTFNPIDESDDDYQIMTSIKSNMSDITDNLKIIHNYYHGSDEIEDINYNESSEESSEEIKEDIVDSTDDSEIQKEDDDHDGNDIVKEYEYHNHDNLIDLLVQKEIDVDKVNKSKASKIFEAYTNGMISAVEACEQIIEVAIEPDEPEDKDNNQDAKDDISKEDSNDKSSKKKK